MGKSERQRALLSAYKEREVTGGVCAVRCDPTGRTLLLPCADPKGQRNRFDFSVSTNSPLHPAMAADWKRYGAAAFSFSCLETLEKKAEQSSQEFRADLDALCALWRERLEAGGTAFY